MKRVFLLGANGFTAQLIADTLGKARIPFVAVARDLNKIPEKAKVKFGFSQFMELNNFSNLADIICDGDIVINAVGPYMQHSREFVDAIVSKAVFYIDLTGEQAFVQWLRDYCQVKRSPACVVQACAFESFVADLLFFKIQNEFRDIKRLESAYWTYPLRPSPGTLQTLKQSFKLPHRYLEHGNIKISDTPMLCVDYRLPDETSIEAATNVDYPELLFASYRKSKISARSFLLGKRGDLISLIAIANLKAKNSDASVDVSAKLAPKVARTRNMDPFDARFTEVKYCISCAGYNSDTSDQSRVAYYVCGANPYQLSADIIAVCVEKMMGEIEFKSGYYTPAELFNEELMKKILKNSGASMGRTQIHSGWSRFAKA